MYSQHSQKISLNIVWFAALQVNLSCFKEFRNFNWNLISNINGILLSVMESSQKTFYLDILNKGDPKSD